MGTIMLSLVLSSFYINHRIFLASLFTLFLLPIVLVFLFFCGNEDVAIWEMGRWSSGIGQSRDHVVSSHLHVVVMVTQSQQQPPTSL